MKWTDEKIEKLITLVEEGYKPKKIAEILDTTYKSINNKMYRLDLKVTYTHKQNCKNCNLEFISYINSNRTFCSSNCSATYNNRNRNLSDETKNKISKTLKSNPRKSKPKKEKICKICKINLVNKKHKRICESCKLNYYKYYRPSCIFTFNPYDYPEEFDLDLINIYGWYSPSNKKNNLQGISKDHKFSVLDGFRNNIDPKIISHPANCELMLFSENSSKKSDSSISINELLQSINLWDNKYSI